MKELNAEQLSNLIGSNQWVIGAVNYDEDLHFSSYYLRASYVENTCGLYPGYTTHIAFYEGFTEHYYLLSEECLQNSQAILERALKEPQWLPDLIREIGRRSRLLRTVFDENLNQAEFSIATDDEIITLYKTHDSAQRSLYEVARVPEALDRGLSYFTHYLRTHLNNLTSGIEADSLFLDLTAPVTPSVLSEELSEFEIVIEIARKLVSKNQILSMPRQARMLLPADVMSAIKRHAEKWQYLGYHGYGHRQVYSLHDYIQRLVRQLA